MNKYRLPIIWLAMTMVTGMSLLFATPDPTPPGPGSNEITTVELNLFKENYTKAKAEMLEYYKKNAPEVAKILEGKKLTAEFVKKHARGSDLKTVVLDLLKPELSSGKIKEATFEKMPFKAYTAFDRGARFAEVPKTNLPTTTNAFNPKVRNGYSPEIAGLNPNAPHTFGNVENYVSDRFTRTAVDRMKNSGAPIEIHAGSDAETFQSLKNRGYQVKGEIRSSLSRYERVYMAVHPKTGEVRYAITNLSGADRVHHMEALLRLSKVDGKRVSVVGDPNTIKERNYSEFLKGFGTSALEGDKALIGFRNEMKKELLDRAIMSRRHQYMVETLGNNPREALLKSLRAEVAGASGADKTNLEKAIKTIEGKKSMDELFKVKSNDVFKRGEYMEKMKRVESDLAKLAKKYPKIKSFQKVIKSGNIPLPGGVSVANLEAARNVSNNTLNMDEYVMRNKNGKRESLKVLANYYGDTMGDLGRALVNSGHKKIGYFGTAGGITTEANPVKVGDIHVPKKVYAPDGTLVSEGRNSFLEGLDPKKMGSLKDRIKMGTNLGNVRTPMVETNDWLKKTRTSGLNSVEVEISHLAKAVKNAPNGAQPKFYSSVIISDVPGSHETLESLNPSKRKRSFSRMLDNYLNAMGVENVELREKTSRSDRQTPTFVDKPTKDAYRVAEALMPKSSKGHLMLRNHIAGTLLETLGPEGLSKVDTNKKLKLSDLKLPESVRTDLQSRIAKPYGDKAVVGALEHGNSRLSYVAKVLNDAGGTAKLKLVGNMAHGNFNPSQNIEFVVEGANAETLKKVKAEVDRVNKTGKGPKIKLVTTVAEGAPTLSLKNGKNFLTEPNYLKRVYADRIYNRSGMILSSDYAGRPIIEYDDIRRKTKNRNSVVESMVEAGLFANYEAATMSPEIGTNSKKFERFKAKLKKYGATVEFIDPATDSRWSPGASGKTVMENGKLKVLLPKGAKVKSLALVEELTHVIDLKRKTNEYGQEWMDKVFEKAKAGDKQAKAMLFDMEIKAKRIALLNMDSKHPLRKSLKAELNKLVTARDKMYNKKLDFKKLMERGDYYSVGRKFEDFMRERGILKKADPKLREAIRETVKIMKYGDPTPEHKKITLIRGVKNDRVWEARNGGHFMLPNRINHGRTSWDKRLSSIDLAFKEATRRSFGSGRYNDAAGMSGDMAEKYKKGKRYHLESIMHDHAASTNNSKKSVFISTSGTAKTIWGPPFYVIKVSPKRALFNYLSPFAGEAEVLLPFFVAPNEVKAKYNSYNEAINDKHVKNSPYFKLANGSNVMENWKTIRENVRNGRAPLEGISGLDSRFNNYNVGPTAETSMVKKFEAKLKKHGALLEYVDVKDPRLRGAQARTYMTADGKIKVLLPKNAAIKKFALIDELTHVNQLKNMAKKYGNKTVVEVFNAALKGDPMAKELMLSWEIKAKKNILLTLDKNDPNRKKVLKSIEDLKKSADPFHKIRKKNGRIDWKKAKTFVKSFGGGMAHFALSLFLKEMVVALKTKDKFVIQEFWDGLMELDFYVHYGLFTASAAGGQFVYTKYLEKFVKPKFANTILKSQFALIVGMAIPDIVTGKFEGKMFALNVTGLFLSSTAMKGGMAAIKWAVPLSKIAGKASWLKKVYGVYKASKWSNVVGWVYTAGETAVVLFFADKITRAITNYLDEKEARNGVGDASKELIAAVKSGDKSKVDKAMKDYTDKWNAYREFLYKPLKEEEARLMMRLDKVGRDLKGMEDAYARYMKLYESDPKKYASLKTAAENIKAKHEREKERRMAEVFEVYERHRNNHLKKIYEAERRNAPMVGHDMNTVDALNSSGNDGILDRMTNWWERRSVNGSFYEPSENRLESYSDEGDVLKLALAMSSHRDVRGLLNKRIDELTLMSETDSMLYETTTGRALKNQPTSGLNPLNTEENATEGMINRLNRSNSSGGGR